MSLFAVTFTLLILLIWIYQQEMGTNIFPVAALFIFQFAIFWLVDPLLKERFPSFVSNVFLIAIYLIVAQILMLVSGGLHSPFFLIYLFVIFTGAMSFGLTGALIATGLVAAAYATFIGAIMDLAVYLYQIIVLWIISLMVGFLAETNRRVGERETLQNLRITSLSEIARFMREHSKPSDVVEAGLEAALRILGATSTALVNNERIIFLCGERVRKDQLLTADKFPFVYMGGDHMIHIYRQKNPLASDEIRIMGLLSERMQLTCSSLHDKAQLEAIREEKERVLDSIGSAVITVKKDNTIATINRRACEILAASSEELLDRKITDSPLQVPSLSDFGREPRESRVFTMKGEEVPVEITVIPQLDDTGKPIGWIAVFDDLKEVRSLKAIIRRSESLAAVGEMAARVAHEIRNPLGGILGFLGLAEKKAQPEIKMYLSESKAAIKRLENTVRDLLTFSRPVSGTQGKFQLIDAWTTLERRETVVETESTEHLHTTIEPLEHNMTTTILRGDIALFTQVLDNLLRNAKEAAGLQGEVAVRVCRGESNLWIEIDDTGPGWPDSVSDKLFEPFISTKESGTGLGLAITQRIVEEVGGSIKCFRTKDGGTSEITRFRVSWPRT